MTIPETIETDEGTIENPVWTRDQAVRAGIRARLAARTADARSCRCLEDTPACADCIGTY